MRIRRNLAPSAPPVALETTLLVHGVPRDAALPLFDELSDIVRSNGAQPALVGVINGTPTVGVTRDELRHLLDAAQADPNAVPKANTANLGILTHNGSHAATTVAATMEIAHAAGVRVFATGGLGGVHKHLAAHPDISADLAALTRFPLAVVTAGVKSLLDVHATREALETLGIPVIGFRTPHFPAFYLRSLDGVNPNDAQLDSPTQIAAFLRTELNRVQRGVVIANPIPDKHQLDPATFADWLAAAENDAAEHHAAGRDTTPVILAALHERSAGATLDANIALVKSNTELAAQIAAAIPRSTPDRPAS